MLLNVSHEYIVLNTGEDLSFRDYSVYFREYDFGLSFGLGMQYPVNQNNISIEIRYDYGLSNFSKLGLFNSTRINTIKLIANYSFSL